MRLSRASASDRSSESRLAAAHLAKGPDLRSGPFAHFHLECCPGCGPSRIAPPTSSSHQLRHGAPQESPCTPFLLRRPQLRLAAQRNDEAGLALLDVLLGLAIFVLIAVQSFGLFRNRAYTTQVVPNSKQLGSSGIAPCPRPAGKGSSRCSTATKHSPTASSSNLKRTSPAETAHGSSPPTTLRRTPCASSTPKPPGRCTAPPRARSSPKATSAPAHSTEIPAAESTRTAWSRSCSRSRTRSSSRSCTSAKSKPTTRTGRSRPTTSSSTAAGSAGAGVTRSDGDGAGVQPVGA